MNTFYLDKTKSCANFQHTYAFDKAKDRHHYGSVRTCPQTQHMHAVLRRRSAAAYMARKLKTITHAINPLTLWTVPVLVHVCTGVGAHTG